MKWIKERDELIAQTKAFVQSVTGRTSGPASTVSTRPASDANPLSYSVTDRAAPNPAISTGRQRGHCLDRGSGFGSAGPEGRATQRIAADRGG